MPWSLQMASHTCMQTVKKIKTMTGSWHGKRVSTDVSMRIKIIQAIIKSGWPVMGLP